MDPVELARTHDTGVAAAGDYLAESFKDVGNNFVVSFKDTSMIVCGTYLYYVVVGPSISKSLQRMFGEGAADVITNLVIPGIIVSGVFFMKRSLSSKQ